MKNRILPAMTRCFAMLLCCFFAMNVQTMQAQTIVHNVQYLSYNSTAPDFDVLTAESCIVFASNTTALGNAWYVVNSNVSVEDRIYVYGSANIILCDGATLTARHGIVVQGDHSLNIYCQAGGTGALIALPTGQVAGIGTDGYVGNNLGTISFHGGNITSSSGEWAAGIGGGICSGGGTINMYGGNISATGRNGDARSIGRGSACGDTHEADIFIADGMCVRINGNSTPVYYENRINSLAIQTSSVRQCTSHSGTDHCIYCGTHLQGDVTHTYDSNNATSGSAPGAATYTLGSTVTIVGNTGNLERTGYVFAGWNTLPDGTGTNYTASQTYSIRRDVVLYAKWQPITYRVRFNKNAADATGTMSDQTFTFGAEQNLSHNVFNRPGFFFAGWSATSSGAVEYADGQSVSSLSSEQGDVVTLYAKWVKSLALVGNTDNNSDIATAAASADPYAVILNNRTIYRDGSWNTICLPFNLNNFAGTPLESATVKTMENSTYSDGILTMNFTDVTEIEAGTPYIVKLDGVDCVIRSEADWDAFAANVNNGIESYEGKVVRLDADISVTTMVGTVSGNVQGNAFCGTFDGGGHTLNVNITDEDNQGTAPFRYISGSTIKNLKTTGTVRGNLHCAGLVGFIASNTVGTIMNCEVAVDVICSGGGHSHCGGILGHALSSHSTIQDCLFSGNISGATSATGIIYGWGDHNYSSITNCVAAGTYSCENYINLAGSNATITNCYSKTSGGTQGIDASSLPNETLVACLGDGWEVRGGQVVPKMPNSIPDIENPVFVGVTISDATDNVMTTYADLIGSYAPFTDASYILDAHNPDGDAIHAAISAHVTAPTGKTLEGWYEDDELTIPVTSIPFATDGSVTMYAKWIPLTYTVHFDPNGDNVTGTMADMNFTYNEPQNLTTNDFRRPCYSFLGWSTTSGGVVEYTDEQSFNDLTAEQGEEIVLYAQWQSLTVEVSTTSSDASYCMNAATVANLSVSISGGEGAPTCQWYKNGTPISGANGASYTPLTDVGGDYDYSIKVYNDCGSDSIHIANIHIFDVVDVTADIVTPSDLCPNQGSYPVSVTVSGGTPNYNYVWSGDATPVDADETTVNQIGANDGEQEYIVTVGVTDQNGCATTATATFTVKPSVKKPGSVTYTCPNDTTITLRYGAIDTLVILHQPSWTNHLSTMPLFLKCEGLTDNNRYAIPEGLEDTAYVVEWHVLDTCGGDSLICTQRIMLIYPECSSVIINGMEYQVTRIGGNCWIRENVREAQSRSSRAATGIRKYNNSDSLQAIYGNLYTWYSAMGVTEDDDAVEPAVVLGHVQGVCPDGWAIPTNTDFLQLIEGAGGMPYIKSPNADHWVSSLVGSEPSRGFDARGGGMYVNATDTYESLMTMARFWTCTPAANPVMGSSVQCAVCEDELLTQSKKDGCSLRCVRIQ
ncbi:MAG: InlB B-repeat-containing protein [Bacteroidales bacterium]|nr:InlB B-repeat-containing protein [Bacteroidales bacterium]